MSDKDEKHVDELKWMDISEFIKLGGLQEINRSLLNPCGLALTAEVTPEGEAKLYGIQDFRDDPEGLIYGDLTKPSSLEKFTAFNDLFTAKKDERVKRFGWHVQPINSIPK